MFEAGADDFVAKPVLGRSSSRASRNRIERTRMLRLAADVDSLTGVATRRRGIEVLERLFRSRASAAPADFHRRDRSRSFQGGQRSLRASRRRRRAARAAAILADAFAAKTSSRDGAARSSSSGCTRCRATPPRGASSRRSKSCAPNDSQAGDETFAVTFSAGVAEFPTDGTDWTTLYRVADESLTRAKTTGRNRVVGGATRDAAEPVVVRGTQRWSSRRTR